MHYKLVTSPFDFKAIMKVFSRLSIHCSPQKLVCTSYTSKKHSKKQFDGVSWPQCSHELLSSTVRQCPQQSHRSPSSALQQPCHLLLFLSVLIQSSCRLNFFLTLSRPFVKLFTSSSNKKQLSW
eukprot:g50026.t1